MERPNLQTTSEATLLHLIFDEAGRSLPGAPFGADIANVFILAVVHRIEKIIGELAALLRGKRLRVIGRFEGFGISLLLGCQIVEVHGDRFKPNTLRSYSRDMAKTVPR